MRRAQVRCDSTTGNDVAVGVTRSRSSKVFFFEVFVPREDVPVLWHGGDVQGKGSKKCCFGWVRLRQNCIEAEAVARVVEHRSHLGTLLLWLSQSLLVLLL